MNTPEAAGADNVSPVPLLQILSLGAGFDSLYFRLKSAGLLSRAVVYEVDFPSVVSRKAALIGGTKDLATVVGGAGGRESGMMFLASHRMQRCGSEVATACTDA